MRRSSSTRTTRSWLGGGALFLATIAAGRASALAPTLRIESNLAAAHFGESLANAGDVNGDGIDDLVVGAPFYGNGESTEGAVFLFLGRPEGLSTGGLEQAQAVIESNQAAARFGTSVGAGDVDGDSYSDLLVGAGGWDGGNSDEGAVFVFRGGPDGLASGGLELASATLEGDWVNARLGTSVAAADVDGDGYDDVVTGGRLYQSSLDQSEEGYALIFLGSESGVASAGLATAHALIQSNQAGAYLGDSVANAGDVNRDGYEDVLIGSPRWGGLDGQDSEGAALLFLGSAAGIGDGDPSTADAMIEGNQTDARFGQLVLGVGDLDGDDYDDIAVGATRFDAGTQQQVTNAGAVFLFHGGPAGIVATESQEAVARLESDQIDATVIPPREHFGLDIAAGYWDADAHLDLLITSAYYDAGQLDEGAAFLFRGSASGIASQTVATADRRLESNVRSAWMGASVALVDLNDDGLADSLVGGNRMGYPLFGLPGEADPDEGMVLGFPLITLCENGGDDDGDASIDLLDAGCGNADDLREEVDYANGGTNTIAVAIADAVVARDQPQGAPTTVVLGLGGTTARDLVAIEHSVLRLDGGGVSEDLVASDSATAELLGGSVAGSVRATDGAVITIRGGSIVALEARDAARIELFGLDFALPNGDVAALAGTLEGTLADGTPIRASFERDAGAAIRLTIPPACQNDVDDDGDTLVDLEDAGCADADDLREEVDYADGATSTITTAIDDTVLARDLAPEDPTTVVLAEGGSTTRDLVAIEHSVLWLDGGSVSGDLVASDSATAELLGGSVAGSVRATDGALITIRGGSIVALEARDAARIELYGLGFALPNGDVAALSGTIEGTLEDGTPIQATFERDATATIHLVPEPAAAAGALAALGCLAGLVKAPLAVGSLRGKRATRFG